MLPLRDIVVFPYMVAPLFVGREKSVNALADAMNKGEGLDQLFPLENLTGNPVHQ